MVVHILIVVTGVQCKDMEGNGRKLGETWNGAITTGRTLSGLSGLQKLVTLWLRLAFLPTSR